MTVNTAHSAHEHPTLADRLMNGRKEGALAHVPRRLDMLAQAFLFFCGALSVLTTIGFVIVLGSESLRFFATTEWMNPNKQITQAITADQTIIAVASQGSALQEGDRIRFGIEQDGEQALVIRVIDEATIEVQRGMSGAAIEHAEGTAIFIGAEVSLLRFLTETKWAPQIGNFGILPLLSSTLRVSGIAMLVSLPLGLGAAIYLSEYASPSARARIKPILEILAGIPTVVYGYFALTFMTPFLRSIFGDDVVAVYNVLSAGIVTGILIIPTISSISEDALSAVPRSLREASYGLGATRLETVFRVLLPAALSGISAAVILGISRAVGETMIALIAAGAGPNFTFNNFDAAETMAGHIARISTGDLSFGSIDYNSVFAVGMTLFVMTLLLNFASNWITRRFREVYA